MCYTPYQYRIFHERSNARSGIIIAFIFRSLRLIKQWSLMIISQRSICLHTFEFKLQFCLTHAKCNTNLFYIFIFIRLYIFQIRTL